ncbi:D-alanyl-D-alanine carboxypeptidase [Phaeovibrio sulfidiphilus]|uniref:D-alanyl-D-alanine carboxypeptidase n=1 Tax=Phaeovibrio sulfidiphilus TaxID=1220600 RepID=A0A8J6YM94_9PROT|nr:D-alanyl-D-alanine carboxypeptidase [Phaeovibrio sulfidiphilus]MBE1236444.1 D-alanyl-D-alanine carboxypeptidase [Phaeovibrio sulfidiphilus]
MTLFSPSTETLKRLRGPFAGVRAFVRGRLFLLTLAVAVGLAAGAGLTPRHAHANPNYAAIVVDANTGQVIHARNADAQRYPASLTKMMTLYLLFEAMENGRYSTSSKLSVSQRAAGQAPSKLGLRPGSTITVETAIKALVAKSANDVAVVVAENIAGSESAFAQQMTAKARALGMRNTTFRNASGLPNTGQVTTARDMLILGLALQKHFPNHYPYFSTMSFRYGNATLTTHNHVLRRYRGADGLKTGYIRASGFNVVSSARRDNARVIAVVMGGQTAAARDAHMMELLDRGFAEIQKRGRGTAVADASGQRVVVGGAAPRSAQGRSTAMASPPLPAPRKPGSGPASVQVAMAGGVPGAALAAAAGGSPRPPADMPDAKLAREAAEADEAQASLTALSTTSASGLAHEAVARVPVVPVEPADAVPGGSWGIQVGAFAQHDRAQTFVRDAHSVLGGLFEPDSLAPFVVPASVDHGMVYRARVFGLPSEGEARRACAALIQANWSCLLVTPAGDNMLAH